MSEEIIQGSPEWFAIRLGKVTASRVGDMIAKTKSGWGSGRSQLRGPARRGTFDRTSVQESYSNAAMKWGTETEPERPALRIRLPCRCRGHGDRLCGPSEHRHVRLFS